MTYEVVSLFDVSVLLSALVAFGGFYTYTVCVRLDRKKPGAYGNYLVVASGIGVLFTVMSIIAYLTDVGILWISGPVALTVLGLDYWYARRTLGGR